MQLKELIRKEIVFTIIGIILIFILLISFSYAYFFQIDDGSTNEVTFGNLELTLCKSADCNTSNDQVGNIIGLTTIADTRVPEKLYPESDEEALQKEPYRFIIKNTGDYDLYVKISLEPDESFNTLDAYIGTEYVDYLESDQSGIKIAVNEQESTPTIKSYIDLTNYVLADNILLEQGESKTFEIRAWESDDASNTNIATYFVTRLSLEGEYIVNE